MDISVITPTFNRKGLITESIDSSLDLVKKNFVKNVIIIDDASTDGTFEYLLLKYREYVNSGVLIIYRLEENIGVTGAKNFGVTLTDCEWIIFMDSDDCFLSDSGPIIARKLNSLFDYDLVFFRCVDMYTLKLLGRELPDGEITLEYLFNESTPGECVPAIRRDVIRKFPYRDSLRGCEGVTYFQMLNNSCRVYLSSEAIRRYRSSGDDRLSNRATIQKRAKQMLMCNIYSMRYIRHANLKRLLGLIARVIYYSYLSIIKRQ